jgi:hypothetical protein
MKVLLIETYSLLFDSHLKVSSHAPTECLPFGCDSIGDGWPTSDLAASLLGQFAGDARRNGDLSSHVFAESKDAVVMAADGVNFSDTIKKYDVVLAKCYLSEACCDENYIKKLSRPWTN